MTNCSLYFNSACVVVVDMGEDDEEVYNYATFIPHTHSFICQFRKALPRQFYHFYTQSLTYRPA